MPEFLLIPSLVDPDLVLPIKGADGEVRKYRIKPATAKQYITLQALYSVESSGSTPAGENAQRLAEIDSYDKAWALTLGDAAKQMQDDGISAADLRRASQTAYQWHLTGGDDAAAEAVWSGKAQSPPETPNDSETPSDGAGAEADSTGKPNSTSGTTTPKATQNGSPARGSGGKTSGGASTSSKRTSSRTTT
jgi:hypothetical protein